MQSFVILSHCQNEFTIKFPSKDPYIDVQIEVEYLNND